MKHENSHQKMFKAIIVTDTVLYLLFWKSEIRFQETTLISISLLDIINFFSNWFDIERDIQIFQFVLGLDIGLLNN